MRSRYAAFRSADKGRAAEDRAVEGRAGEVRDTEVNQPDIAAPDRGKSGLDLGPCRSLLSPAGGMI